MDHTPGSVKFETKPATTSVKRSTCAGSGDFLSRCLHGDRSFLSDCGRLFPAWFLIHRVYNLSTSSLSFNLVIGFVILEVIPTTEVSSIFVALPVDKQCGLFSYACCSGNTQILLMLSECLIISSFSSILKLSSCMHYLTL